FLVPVRVFLPVPPDKVAAALVNELLHGPPAALQGVVTTAIPPTTTQSSINQLNDVVTVELSDDLASLTAAERDRAAAQIAYTLRDFGTGEIRIDSGGQPLATSRGQCLQT